MKTDIQLTPHFNLKEFLHNGSDEGLTAVIVENLRALANKLEMIRKLLGAKPIHINSGFRTVKHNAEVGGAEHSEHLHGLAADIVVEGLSPAQVQAALKDWQGGLGSYPTWTHVDLGPRRRWTVP